MRKHIVEVISPCKGCTKCYFCRSLDDTTQAGAYGIPPCVIWLMPKDHGYVREQIDDSLAVLTVALDTHESSAIVIQSADQLHSATANRLLKIIEEPPAGWHIILTTERPADVLPTLRSRCIDRHCEPTTDNFPVSAIYEPLPSPIMLWLENPSPARWLEICGKIDELPRTVPATISALDRLIKLWHTRWSEHQDFRSQAMLTILTEMAENPPPSGGTNGFWRVVLIRVCRALNT